jgi:hypothetical protein
MKMRGGSLGGSSLLSTIAPPSGHLCIKASRAGTCCAWKQHHLSPDEVQWQFSSSVVLAAVPSTDNPLLPASGDDEH